MPCSYKLALPVVTLFTSLLCGPVVAADTAKGKAKSSACVACHGANGKAFIPGYPHLAGQNETYLVNQLIAFREKTRINMQMNPLMAGWSDEDIADVAAYYAKLPAEE